MFKHFKFVNEYTTLQNKRQEMRLFVAVSYKTTLLKKQIVSSTVKWYVPIFNTLNNFRLFSRLDK